MPPASLARGVRRPIKSITNKQMAASTRAKGDMGEQLCMAALHRCFTGCNVVSTARMGQSGDIRFDLPTDGGEDVSLFIEIKHHTNSVQKGQVSRFVEHLASPSAAWAEAGLFISLTSSIHGKPDYTVCSLSDGREYGFISCLMLPENTTKLEAAVRLMVARALHRRNHLRMDHGWGSHPARLEALYQCLETQRGATERLQRAVTALTTQMHGVISSVSQLENTLEAPAPDSLEL